MIAAPMAKPEGVSADRSTMAGRTAGIEDDGLGVRQRHHQAAGEQAAVRCGSARGDGVEAFHLGRPHLPGQKNQIGRTQPFDDQEHTGEGMGQGRQSSGGQPVPHEVTGIDAQRLGGCQP